MKVIKCFSKVLLLLLLSSPCFAQNTDSTKVAADSTMISVDRIILLGNKVTRPSIIYRELIFHKDDTLPEYVLDRAIERSRENLMNTLLFNFVQIDKLNDINNKRSIVITMTERWYIFPIPIIEFVDRNFNEWLKTKDFSRINYGFVLSDNNFRGAKELFQVSARFGYSQKFAFNYVIPYLNRAQENGLNLMGGYNRNHEISYTLTDSKLTFYKNEDIYVRKEYYGLVRYTHRDRIYNYASFGVEYRFSSIADTVAKLNDRYFVNGTTFEQFIALGYKWSRDMRDYKIYSLHGYYFDAEVNKVGLGILKNEPNLLFITSSFKNTNEISRRWHLGYSIKGRICGQSEAPFYNQRALGYQNDFVRSYEYYVINGQSFALAKTNLKFSLVPQRIFYLGAIGSDKFNTIPYAFYLNAFCDVGYVRDKVFAETNPLANQFLPGYGLGIDFVTYYNIVIRLEYSFNKFGENGFFLHFTNALY
ncbi:MAG: hypothetical protein ABI723_16515 [Bacteroidia bacterium]